MDTIIALQKKYNLKPHPEGGFYTQTYRSSQSVQVNHRHYEGATRLSSTAIYFLLTAQTFSAWHKLKSDELWHFYDGSPMQIYTIDEHGMLSEHRLGKPTQNHEPQLLIPGDTWFCATTLLLQDDYSFVGCTVAPGFEFQDFELGDRQQLLLLFPQHAQLICDFTRLPHNECEIINYLSNTSRV